MNVCAAKGGVRLASYDHPDCLIYGIGNVGRQDDGLGWAFIEWLEESTVCPQAETVQHYQLQLEDADLIRSKRRVLFVDATKAPEVDSVHLEAVFPRMDSSFTSHALSIPTIMATCQTCFGTVPEVQLLTIKGYEWELKLGLTEDAKRNLAQAIQLFQQERR
ncbi:MAG: hydrogenase maturation protease [Rhodospirillaceae bacterium]